MADLDDTKTVPDANRFFSRCRRFAIGTTCFAYCYGGVSKDILNGRNTFTAADLARLYDVPIELKFPTVAKPRLGAL